MKKQMMVLVMVLVICVLAAGMAISESYTVPLPEEMRGEGFAGTVVAQPEGEGSAAAGPEVSQKTAINLTPVINAAIALIGEILMAVIAVSVIPTLRAWMQTKLSKTQQEKTVEFIRQMVLAAEQVIGKGCGGEKLEYVVRALERKGFSVDVNLIEAAVKDMNDRNLQWLFEKGADDVETDDPEA